MTGSKAWREQLTRMRRYANRIDRHDINKMVFTRSISELYFGTAEKNRRFAGVVLKHFG